MTTVENVTQNLIPGFGAAVSGTSALDQSNLIGAADVNLNLLTDFSEQVEAITPAAAVVNGLVNAQQAQGTPNSQSDLNKVSATGLIAAPADTSLLIDPTTDTNSPVIVQSLRGAGVFFPSFDEDKQAANTLVGAQALGAENVDDSLSVGFVAATQDLSSLTQPLVATGAAAQTQANKLSTNFSPLPTISELAHANSLTQARGAGHVLPVAELETLHGSAQVSNVTPGSQANTPALSAAAQNAATAEQTTSTGPAVDPSLVKATTPLPADASNALNNFANDALKQAETLSLKPAGGDSSLNANPVKLNGGENAVDENIDADGQVLSVMKKAGENSFVAHQRLQNIAQQSQSQSNQTHSTQTQGNSAATTQAAASTASVATTQSGDGASARPLPATEKRDALNITAADSASTAPRTNIDQITPAQRAAVNWSSPWSGAWTPERAAGWPEGFGTDVIASGLTGMKGEGGGLMGMGLMGGKANAALGGHVAKQLNVNVTRAVKAGDSEFAMRMDPPELGKVTVKLKFGADGMVRANVLVERPETLELLQRETRGLEKAIEAGGSKTAEDGISFSLDSGNEESAGKAFAEAVQEDRLKEALSDKSTGDDGSSDHAPEDLTETIDLEEILAHVTPETGLDVRV